MAVHLDYYGVLSVQRSATAEEIHQAFRQKARVLHPDVNPSPDATRQFQELNNAYQTLSDPSKRAAYDRASGGYETFGRSPGSSGYWTPPPRYRSAQWSSTPDYDEPFAPRRRRPYSQQPFEFRTSNVLRWIWLPIVLVRLCSFTSTGWWNTANVIAFINDWLPTIAIVLIAVLAAIGVWALAYWWKR